MKPKVQPRIYKGTRDFLPDQMVKRNYVIDIIRKVFERYGFEPLETPTLEMWETLSGKYGEEGDRLTYRFTDRGKREVGLRYDLTVPLSRVIAMYPQIPKPFKRYQIQPVWRADKPQKGRFREFYQCDVDVIGSASMLADTEIIAVVHNCLRELGFSEFTIRINSRKVLSGLAEASGAGLEQETNICRAIDKLDKIGPDGVNQELRDRGITKDAVNKISHFLHIGGSNSERLKQAGELLKDSESGQAGIREMEELLRFTGDLGIDEHSVLFDLTLARGLDYYTGPIFETVVEKPRIGSVTGGGRYDRLIGLFSGQDQPATGSSIGLERIVTVMDELNMFPGSLRTPVQVLVTVFDEQSSDYSIRIGKLLRDAGLNTDIYCGSSRLRGQFGLANDKGIPLVVIAGSNEIDQKAANLKDMRTGNQQTLPLTDLAAAARQLLTD